MLNTLTVAFILASTAPAAVDNYYAFAPNQIGGWTYLTKNSCRYDKTMTEAYTTDAKGNKTYECYWFGITNIFFKTSDNVVRSLPKRDFETVSNVI
jgi:hypothetical protein